MIKLLDAVYLNDSETSAFCAFKDFVDHGHGSRDLFSAFIVEFKKRNREIAKYEMTLSTVAQACFLLLAENLTIDKERLARAALDNSSNDGSDTRSF